MRAGVYRPVENRGGELLDRIRSGPPLLLDGATGTELERRGVPTPLPLWSAPALFDTPEIVEAIHLDYAAVGVDALTANTFRTQRRTLSRGGGGDRAGETTRRAVEIARRAAARAPGATPFVLGSAPPLEDCYRPDLVPEPSSLAREHAEHAEHLAGAGVDGVLVETMNTVIEALAALRAVRATGLPALVSFVCWEGATLLSGEALAGAADAVAGEGADAVMVNCLPTANVAACLPDLARCALPFGVYANLGAPDDDDGFRRSDDCTPETFADHASAWRDAGARILGGCCGTTPEHLGALARRLSKV
jgi:S-methylmethionine-dependent homocysteine/selenocysteine methylase